MKRGSWGKDHEAAMEKRRAIVATNLLSGMDYRDIASALGVSLSTVAGDVKAIINAWKQTQQDKIDDFRAMEIKRLDLMLNAIWSKAVGTVENPTPNLGYLDRALKILERRAKLMGLDAPVGIDVTSKGEKLPIAIVKMHVDEL